MKVVFCALLICLLGFQKGTCYTNEEHANAYKLVMQYLYDNVIVNQGIISKYVSDIEEQAPASFKMIGENLRSLNVPKYNVTSYLEMSAQRIEITKSQIDPFVNENSQMWLPADELRVILSIGPGASLFGINEYLDDFHSYETALPNKYETFIQTVTYESEGFYGLSLLDGLEGPLVDETKTLLAETRASFVDCKTAFDGFFIPYEKTFSVVYEAVAIIAVEE